MVKVKRKNPLVGCRRKTDSRVKNLFYDKSTILALIIAQKIQKVKE